MSITLQSVRKQFGAIEVLKGIDFSFEPGQINMIIGASGSGKTVLLKCMVGLLAPTTGTILYEGQNLHTASADELRELRRRMGMLFQGAALFDSMTVGENVAFPLKMFTSLSPTQIRDKAIHTLERVNLVNVEHRFPSEISGGMKKRVGIARAIVLDPDYLFCDEPNSGLDPQTAEVIDVLLRELTDQLGITTIIVSHDMKSVLSIGDHILFIYKGNKEWEGDRDAVSSATNMHLRRFIETSGVRTSESAPAATGHRADTHNYD
jgi:phospholipid/cholesterol/gamma-HCH transport system ATP-binding protein